MNAKALRELTDAELKSKLDDLGAESMKLRFQKATMQLANTARCRQVRAEIARIQTILNERKRSQEVQNG